MPRKAVTEFQTVIYIGNFDPPHSTENHVARALETNGVIVERVQENDPKLWVELLDRLAGKTKPADLILWTRTGWHWPSQGIPGQMMARYQREMLRVARDKWIPTVGYHLDIWWGLKRVDEVWTEPFFEVDYLITADGGHQQQFADAKVRHFWMPPAISENEARVGQVTNDFVSKLAFVGSWTGGYHTEHQHRHDLVRWLESNYRRDCKFWPQQGQPSIRGGALQDLYASVDVVVGDSCFAGSGVSNYWSDRIPETLGRGGMLLHPHVPGIEAHFTPGEHLFTWQAGDWDELHSLIDDCLAAPKSRLREIALAGRAHVLEHHTYEVRMRQMFDLVRKNGMV